MEDDDSHLAMILQLIRSTAAFSLAACGAVVSFYRVRRQHLDLACHGSPEER